MNKLIHPGVAFLQALTYDEVAFKDMTGDQQFAIFRYMHCDGEGYWGAFDSVNVALFHVGDVRFGVGKFANNDIMKTAFVVSIPNGIDEPNPVEYFDKHILCTEKAGNPFPVIIASNPELAGEFGLFDEGYDEFYYYWSSQPETEFIRCLPGWNPEDDSGRGGQ